MDNVPNENGQPHWCRLQDAQDELIARKRVACAQSAQELGEAVGDANGDGQQACVECPDQTSSINSLVCGQTSVFRPEADHESGLVDSIL
jgi:hypothetical protein